MKYTVAVLKKQVQELKTVQYFMAYQPDTEYYRKERERIGNRLKELRSVIEALEKPEVEKQIFAISAE